MEYDDYVNLINEAAQLDQAGDVEGALALFKRLIEANLTEFDRSLMCHNAGVLLDKLGRTDEALAVFDRGMSLEAPLSRYLVAEQKAALLHRLGRNSEALSLYRWMESRRWAGAADKHRFRHNIAVLTGG